MQYKRHQFSFFISNGMCCLAFFAPCVYVVRLCTKLLFFLQKNFFFALSCVLFCSVFGGKMNQQKIIIECTPAGIIWRVYISGNHKTYIITKIICTSCAFMLCTLFCSVFFLSLSDPLVAPRVCVCLWLSRSHSWCFAVSLYRFSISLSFALWLAFMMMNRLRSSGLWSISMHPAIHAHTHTPYLSLTVYVHFTYMHSFLDREQCNC